MGAVVAVLVVVLVGVVAVRVGGDVVTMMRLNGTRSRIVACIVLPHYHPSRKLQAPRSRCLLMQPPSSSSNNINIKVGYRVFKQTIEIPMGTDCAPSLAIRFLLFYEYEYVKDKQELGCSDIPLDTLMTCSH